MAILGWALARWQRARQQRVFDITNRSLIDRLQEGIVLCGNGGRIVQINRAAATLLNMARVEVEGKSFFRAHNKARSVLFDKCCHALRQAKATHKRAAFSFCLDRTEECCYEVAAEPLSKTMTALFLTSSTAHHRIQQVGKDFIANASHELRTPITIIKGFAETLRDLPQISEEMLEDFIEKIVRNCQRMEHLVKNLLTLADLDQLPKHRMQECDLVALVDSCVHMLLKTHSETQVETWYNRDVVTLFGDPDLLELAILNVLENGVKYSAFDPQLKITIEQLPQRVRLSIADSGIGIPHADLERIFDRFYTVNKARSRKLGGAGLGLSIVKTIVKKHRGSIVATSKIGCGTTFTFEFSPR